MKKFVLFSTIGLILVLVVTIIRSHIPDEAREEAMIWRQQYNQLMLDSLQTSYQIDSLQNHLASIQSRLKQKESLDPLALSMRAKHQIAQLKTDSASTSTALVKKVKKITRVGKIIHKLRKRLDTLYKKYPQLIIDDKK